MAAGSRRASSPRHVLESLAVSREPDVSLSTNLVDFGRDQHLGLE